MFQREESRHDLAFMAGVIIGAISGAIAALALTPMSGAETREKLRETSGNLGPVKEKVTTTASQAVAPVKEKATEAVHAASQAVGPMKEKAAEAVSSASHAVGPMKDKAAEIAAKSPLPVGNKHEEQDVVMSEDVARDAVDDAVAAAKDAGDAVQDAAKDATAKIENATDRPSS